jgi:pentose-5-phosphate-3-epimerase
MLKLFKLRTVKKQIKNIMKKITAILLLIVQIGFAQTNDYLDISKKVEAAKNKIKSSCRIHVFDR